MNFSSSVLPIFASRLPSIIHSMPDIAQQKPASLPVEELKNQPSSSLNCHGILSDLSKSIEAWTQWLETNQQIERMQRDQLITSLEGSNQEPAFRSWMQANYDAALASLNIVKGTAQVNLSKGGRWIALALGGAGICTRSTPMIAVGLIGAAALHAIAQSRAPLAHSIPEWNHKMDMLRQKNHQLLQEIGKSPHRTKKQKTELIKKIQPKQAVVEDSLQELVKLSIQNAI